MAIRYEISEVWPEMAEVRRKLEFLQDSTFSHFTLQNATRYANALAARALSPRAGLNSLWRQLRSTTALALAFSATSVMAQGWNDNLRSTIDLSSRAQYLTKDAPSQLGFFNSVGIDANKVVSRGNRDIVTINLQVNLWCINGLTRRPGLFDGPDDCKIVNKVSTANFAVRGNGKFNVLVGHGEVPFGLEVPVSTSQTIRQLTNNRDLGLKLDWAAGFNGTAGGLHYSTTLGRGSGMEYKKTKEPYSIAGRVGTATDNEAYLGLPGAGISGFYGNVLTRTGSISERWRLALDGIYYRGPIGLMGQVSIGETDEMDTVNGLVEMNAINRGESLVSYLQVKSYNQDFATGWQDAWSVIAGARFTPDSKWALSAQVERELSAYGPRQEQTIIDLQIRYRF
jgi:hypothetical protein